MYLAFTRIKTFGATNNKKRTFEKKIARKKIARKEIARKKTDKKIIKKDCNKYRG